MAARLKPTEEAYFVASEIAKTAQAVTDRLADRANRLAASAERERAARVGRAAALVAERDALVAAHAANVAELPFMAGPPPVHWNPEDYEDCLDRDERRSARWVDWGARTARKFAEAPWEAWLCTYTLPHSAGSPLEDELVAFTRAWDAARSGRGAAALNRGVLGSHVARELTLGDHGWHYHHHVCMYCRADYPFYQLRERWLSAVRAVGRWRDGADEHAFDAAAITDTTGARYVAKISGAVDAAARAVDAASRAAGAAGMEMAGGSLKAGRRTRAGRNLMTLLHDAAFSGDRFAREKWLEAARVITARKIASVRWSPGLRDLVGITAKSDAAVATDEITHADVLLGALEADQWVAVCRARCELALCIAANQGRESVNILLANINAGALHDAPAEFVA